MHSSHPMRDKVGDDFISISEGNKKKNCFLSRFNLVAVEETKTVF